MHPKAALAAALICLAIFIYAIGGDLWNRHLVLGCRDIPVLVIPNLEFVHEAVTQGFLPQIHLRRGAGTPFMADPQTSFFYPLTLIAAIFPPDDGFRVFQFFHVFWLGLGWFMIARRLGIGVWGSLVVGVTLLSSQPTLRGLEWLPITAGNAWVPWVCYAAMQGWPRFWAVAIALSVLSGHAYLWVMIPVIAASSLFLCRREVLRPFFLALLLIPLLTAPLWIGYLTLSQEVLSHGFEKIGEEQITWFEPQHYASFLMPRAFRDFMFLRPDGKKELYAKAGPFAWSRLSYLGLLPILVLPVALLGGKRKFLLASLCLVCGGALLATLFPAFLRNHSTLFLHVHHPASFIQLAVLGISLLFPIAWKKLFGGEEADGIFSDSPGNSGLQRFYAFLIVLFLGFAIIHVHLSEQALRGEASPIWNFSFMVNWQAYPLGCLICGLLVFSFSPLSSHRRVLKITAASLLILLQMVDLAEFNFPRIPYASRAEEPLEHFLPKDLSPSGRIWFTDFVQTLVLGSVEFKEKPISQEFRSFWNARSDFPNIAASRGFSQVNDCNPPFQQSALRGLLNRLDNASNAVDLDRLLNLVGVQYVVSEENRPILAPARKNGWELVTSRKRPGNPDSVILWRRPCHGQAWLIATETLRWIDEGGSFPAPTDSPVQITWSPNACRIELPANIDQGLSLLFVPLTPFKGWSAKIDGKNASAFPHTGFGLAVPVSSGQKTVELAYHQPLLSESLVMWSFGLLGLAFGFRRRSA